MGDIRALLLRMGRVAMVVMAGLALHADGKHGIIHDFLQVGISEAQVVDPLVLSRPTVEVQPGMPAPLCTDVILQDVPFEMY